MNSTRYPNYSMSTTRCYQSYLLRIWREDDSLPWRAQVENPSTNETHGFPTLKALLDFLEEQSEANAATG
jgi:hypothetical protein